MSIQELKAGAQDVAVSNLLQKVLSKRPEETKPQVYGPYLAYIREQSVELETVLTFFRSLRTSLGSYCLQAPEDALQVGVTLSEVCQYGHALIHDPTHEDSSNLVESVQVLFYIVTEGVSLLHSYYKEMKGTSQAVLPTVHQCLQMMDIGFFSMRWLQMAGSHTFSTVAGDLRSILKEHIIPLISTAYDSNWQGLMLPPCFSMYCHVNDERKEMANWYLPPRICVSFVLYWQEMHIKARVARPGNSDVQEGSFIEALRQVLHDLLLLGTKCAHAIAGTEEDLSAKEFRSFGTLNAIWGSLIKAVVGVPPAIVRALIDLERQSLEDMDGHFFSSLVNSLTANTLFEFQKLVDWPQANQLQVFRFWLQALMKILATLPDVVLWKVKQLIRLGYQMYDLTTRARDASQSSDPNMSSAILNAVKRYVACILDNAEGRNEENKPFQIFMTEIIASSEAPLFLLKGRLLFAVDLLSRAPLLQGDCWLLSLKQFLPWMVTASKQLYHDFMDNSHMQLQLVECFTSFTYCLGRFPTEDRERCLREFHQLLVRMSIDFHPFAQHLLLQILLSIMVVEPSLLEEYLQFLAQLAHNLSVLGQIGDSHPIELLCDNIVQLAGNVLRNSPQHFMDCACLEVLQGCSESESLLVRFVELRYAARVLAIAYDAQLPLAIQDRLHSHLKLIIDSAFLSMTRGSHQNFLYSILCIEEVLQALGGNQVHQQERERIQELLDITLKSPMEASVAKVFFYIVASCKEIRETVCMNKVLTVATSLAHVTAVAAACAEVAQYSIGTADGPAKLFCNLFQAPQWTLRFETCQSLVQFGRLPESGNFRKMIPDSLLEKTENGESPLMIQLKQHIQQKYFQTDLPVRDAAESAAEEGIVLGNSSKELPLAVCRLVANTVTSAKRHCLQEADQESDVFAATQDALKGLVATLDEYGVQLLQDSSFEKVYGQLADVLVRMQNLKGPPTSDPQEHV